MKILIGALSAWKYADRRKRCLSTWVPRLRELGHETMFLVGVEQATAFEQIGDYLILPCPDRYETLTQKTRKWCEWALKRDDWTWLFKCDDDTYVAPDRLSEFVKTLDEENHWYVGAEWQAGVGYGSGGGGYLLNRRAAERVAEHLTAMAGAEDLEVGKLLRATGAMFHINNRFVPYGKPDRRPMPNNDLITAHAFSAELFVDCHQQLYPARLS